MSSSTSQFWTETRLALLTPEFFESLKDKDAIGVLLEFKRLGFLDAILKGEEQVNFSQEGGDDRLYLAIQVVSRYLSQTIRAFSSREQTLQNLLSQCDGEIRMNHARFNALKAQREAVRAETLRVEEEITQCDRILKSNHHSNNGGTADSDEDSPWEENYYYDVPSMLVSSTRASAAFPSMMMASPMNINHVFNHSFFQQQQQQQQGVEAVSSPKYTSRSRASSGNSTQGGMMSEDDLVLFKTMGGNAWEKVKEASSQLAGGKKKLGGIQEGLPTTMESLGDEEEEEVRM